MIQREERGANRVMLTVFIIAALLSGAGFLYKAYEFLQDLLNENGLGFAGSHLMSYVLVAGGFICLLVAAFLRGHFHDIEEPKYKLLEDEERHDREEFAH